MDFITTIDASKEWGISSRRITTLCNEGRVEGAELIGRTWFIPKYLREDMKMDFMDLSGRVINLLGDPVDNLPAPEVDEKWSIHRPAPSC